MIDKLTLNLYSLIGKSQLRARCAVHTISTVRPQYRNQKKRTENSNDIEMWSNITVGHVPHYILVQWRLRAVLSGLWNLARVNG